MKKLRSVVEKGWGVSYLFTLSLFFLLFPAYALAVTPSDDYALHFDGGDRVLIPDSPSLNPSQITVETWVYLNRLAPIGSWNDQFLISKGNDQTEGSYSLSAHLDQFHFYIGANGVDQVHATTPSLVKTNLWYHVAGTYDGSTIKIYVNGVLQGQAPANVAIGNTGLLSFGYHDLAGSEYTLDGILDEVRIWNTARTAAEIQADMFNTLTGGESGLVGYWPMNEGAGQVVGDSSSNGNHGQLGSTSGEDTDDPAWGLVTDFQDSLVEDFETGGRGWMVENGVWEIGTPTGAGGPGGCYAGTQCVGTILNGNYPGETDSRLISATTVLPMVSGSEEIHLRFQNWFSYAAGDSGQVQVSVWDPAVPAWGGWVNVGMVVVDYSGWSLKDVEMTEYGGKTVRIAFYHSAVCTGGYCDDQNTGWYIDEVQIVKKVPEYTGDFESGWGDWGTDRGVWQVGEPKAGPTSCYSGTQCAGTELSGSYGGETDSRLISATTVLPVVSGSEEIHLRFQNWFSYAAGDSGQVQVSVWDPAVPAWGGWVNVGMVVVDYSGWSLKDVEMTEYGGKTVRIAFYHFASCTGGYCDDQNTGWYIDEVQIVKKVPEYTGDFESGWGDWGTDRGVWQVGEPKAGPTSCYSGTQCAGTELSGSYGGETDSRLISATTVLPVVSGSEEIHLRFQNWFSYAAGDSGQVQVSVWDPAASAWGGWVNVGIVVVDYSGWSLKDVEMTEYGGKTVRIAFYHFASCTGGYCDDQNTGWYIDEVQIVKKVPEYTGDFESGWGDWGTDRGVWQVGTPTVGVGPGSCYSGTQCAGTELSGSYGGETDSRLISATTVLPVVSGSEEIHLRFQNWFSYAAGDSGQVQVSVWDPAASAWGGWVNVGIVVVDYSGWSLKDVEMTEYGGKTVRIAFYHFASCTGGYCDDQNTGWYIDEVQIVKKVPEYTGDFESGWGDWGTDRGVWQVGTPTVGVGPGSCYSGTQCAGTELSGSYGGETDSRLISATTVLPVVSGSEEIHLRFQNWFSYAAGDSGQVQVSVWDPAVPAWGGWVNVGMVVVDYSGWSLKDVEMTEYGGKTVRIAFYHFASCTGGYCDDQNTGWYIDEVQIVKKVPEYTGDFESGWGDWGTDRGVWQVGTPTVGVGPGSCYSGTQCAGTELSGSYGGETDSRLISATTVLPVVSGSEEIHLRFQNWFSYAAGDSGQVQVSVWDPAASAWGGWVNVGIVVVDYSGWSLKDVEMTEYGGKTVRIAFYHFASCTGGYCDDQNTGWYIDEVQIVKKVPEYTGDFESGWGDWGTDRGVWQVGTPTVGVGPGSCYSGTQCAGTELSGSYGGETDSRLISATTVLPVVSGSEEIHLRFQNWFSYAAGDSGQVQVSVWDPAASAWGGWVNVGIVVVDYSGWSLKDVEMTEYGGKTVRIAFYHFASCTGGYCDDQNTGWYIDEVQIVKKVPEYTGDFESGWGDWGTDRGVWQVGTPTVGVGPGSCYSGTQCAGTELKGNYGGETDSRLISATTVLPVVSGSEEIHLRFQNWFSYAAGDSGVVQISTYNETSGWSVWNSVPDSTVSGVSRGWVPGDLKLTTYAGQTVRIAFYHFASCTGGYCDDQSTGWYIDDIKIIAGICTNDTDCDGMPDDWENDNGLDPNNPDDAGYDKDNDGLSNLNEYRNGTDPNNSDTDGDGLPDGWEVSNKLNPLFNDAGLDPDGDGLTNIEEFRYGLNPNEAETGRVAISPDALQVSLGGTNRYQINVTNLKATPEEYTLAVEGLDPSEEGLDPSWYTLSKNTLDLLSGEEKVVNLDIHIPEECGIVAQDYPFNIRITPTGAGPSTTIQSTMTVVRDPILSALSPADGEAMGSNRLLITWRSDAPGTTEVHYRDIGSDVIIPVVGTPGNTHSINIENLDWETEYAWSVQTQTLCGLSQSETRSNFIETGIVFEGEPYEFFIERDYEQVAAINVRNIDTIAHELLLTLLNDNEDLIAGFRGDGSTDQRMILQPGEVQSVEVAFHAQDAGEPDYKVMFRISADTDTSHPIISYAGAVVHVHHPVFNFSLEEINTDPFTLTNTFRLTNNGDPVTDIRVEADEASRPFMTFSPIIEHLRLGTGESIAFKVMTDREMVATITATGAGEEVSINTHFGCAVGTNPFKVSVDKPEICREVRGAYCTNRPDFAVPFTLPAGLARTVVEKSALYTHFSLNTDRWRYRPHDVDIDVNKNGVLSLHNTIPEGEYSTLFPPSFLNYSIVGEAKNAIQVHTRHLNGGHYVVVADFDVVLKLNAPIDVTVCAADEADAQVKAQEKVINLSCGKDPDTLNPCPRVVDLRILDPETGDPKNKFLIGDRVRFEVNIINPDAIEHVMNLNIHMDDNPDDVLPAVQIFKPVIVPGDSSNTQAFDWTITDALPAGEIFVSVSLDDASCRTETPYSYSFRLGVDVTPPDVRITDEGIYSVENSSIFADWFATDPESGISEYDFQIGTAPCLGDVQPWKVTTASGPQSLPASLTYGETYYVCVKATNSRGLESIGVSTNGITILDPDVDPDNDRFKNRDEVSSRSNPFNPASFPGTTTLNLRKGFNLVSFPAETLYFENLMNLMEGTGGSTVISRLLVLDPLTQTFSDAGYNNAGASYGQNISLPAVQGQVGMIIYAKQDADVSFTSTYCPIWDLYAGTNIVGTPCMPPQFNSFKVLGAFGEEAVSAIQRFIHATGRFETSAYSNGGTVGMDFPLRAGEGYIVTLRQDRTGINPETLNIQGPVGTECSTDSDCIISGCSGQICASEPVMTTCEWREEYACYQDPGITTCGCTQGTCGWAQTPELERCLNNAGGP